MRFLGRMHGSLLLCLALAAAVAAAPELLVDEPTSLVYPPFWHTPLGIHRGTPDMLALFTGGRARFAAPAGLACARLLGATGSDGDDCRVTVIGANSGQANLIYNPSMTQLDLVGGREPGHGWFQRPMGVALAPDGTACVTDPAQRRVLRLRLRDGRLQADGELMPPPRGWQEPWGVAFDSTRRLYVSDAASGQIHCYSPEGIWQRSLGPVLDGAELAQPRALAVADAGEIWSSYRDNYLYVCDRGGSRLLRLGLREPSASVQVQTSAALLPASDTPAAFAWLALDFYENVWVTDSARCQIHKFNRHLRYLTSYGGRGTGDGHFQQPTGLAINRHFGQVFVADREAAHYYWIGTDLLHPAAAWLPIRDFAELRFDLTEPSQVSVSVQAEGDSPRTVWHQDWMDSGPQKIIWRCPEPLRGRTLTFRLTAEATYSSASYFAKQVTITLPAEQSSK
jgi:hypothetical protein